MHLFRSHRDTPGMFRGHARFTLPDNPVCWLTGHHPKVEVVENRYADPWVKVECRVCGRRYHEDPARVAVIGKEYDTPEKRKELAAARVANARRDPRNYLSGVVNRRAGWATNDAGVNVEAHWWGFHRNRIANNIGFRLHLGDTGSETPYDVYVGVGVAAVYVSAELHGRFAEWVGRGHKRDLSVQVHDGSLWWKLWYDDDGGHDAYHRCDSWRQPRLWPWSAGRRKHRGWMCLRDGNIDLNPVDAFYGSRLWLRDDTFEKVTKTALVHVGDFPGDEYMVDFTLERREVRRRNGPGWARRVKRVDYDADARCETGIPVRNDSWKGDDIIGWSVKVPTESVADGSWLVAAVEGTIEQVRRDRAHYRYTAPAGVE